MPYKKYTGKEVDELLGLQLLSIKMFADTKVAHIAPSTRLTLSLEIAQEMALTTEKAVSEYVVSPTLGEIKVANKEHVTLFSGEQLNVDRSRNLNGEVDFFFAKTTHSFAKKAPIICIVEAKIGLIDSGIPQAAAQMYGARLKNEQEGNDIRIIYGAVTDGKTWRFLRLEGQVLYTDLAILYLDNVPLLLGTLQWVIDFYN
jgi:hypothetical protein